MSLFDFSAGSFVIAIALAQAPRPSSSDEESAVPGLGALPKGVAPEYEGLGIGVRRADLGTLVSGATVRYAKHSDFERLKTEGGDPDALEPDAVLARVGRELRTGANGFAIGESEPGRMLVEARYADLYGWTWIDRGRESRAIVWLYPERTLEVRTVGPDGKPLAGVGFSVLDAACNTVFEARTGGEHANFVLPHAIARFASASKVTGGYSIVLAGAFSTVPSQRFEPELLSAAPHVLALPPSGRVRVRVQGPDDGALAFQPRVELRPRSAGAGCNARPSVVADANGVALFDAVELNSDFEVVADGLDLFADVRASIEGPSEAGATREVELRFARSLPALQGAFVNQDGAALETAFTRVWLVGPEGVARELGTIATKKQKRFLFPIEDVASLAAGSELFFLLGDDASNWYRIGRRTLESTLESVRLDLAEVRCDVAKTIAQGTLIDEAQKPVAGSIVRLRRATSESTASLATPWSAVSDERGRFRVRGIAPSGALSLEVEGALHFPATLSSIEAGREGLSIGVVRAGAISGRLVLPDWLARPRVQLVATTNVGTRSTTPRDDGRFELDQLAAGTFGVDVMLEIGGRAHSVAKIGELVTVVGERRIEPKLAAFDFAARVQRFVVNVVDSDGHPIDDGCVRYELESDGRVSKVEVPIEHGRAEVIAVSAHVAIEIDAPAHALRRVAPLAADARVVLERSP